MPNLPQKKVGIVACSGEEIAEGTVTRLAALQVLEELRPEDTVTICLPLFLAGGEGDRAFARFYPTIAVDGCELRCAARATEMYSNKPAASIVVTDIAAESGLDQITGCRRLNDSGQRAVTETAVRLATLVDNLLDNKWSRRQGEFIKSAGTEQNEQHPKVATCACGSGIPVQTVQINGKSIALIALPVIFEQFQQAGKGPTEKNITALLEQVKIYNPVPAEVETVYHQMLTSEYTTFWEEREPRL